MAPLDALKESARVLVTHLRLIAGAELEEELDAEAGAEVEEIPHQAYATPIEDLLGGMLITLKRTGISNVERSWSAGAWYGFPVVHSELREKSLPSWWNS